MTEYWLQLCGRHANITVFTECACVLRGRVNALQVGDDRREIDATTVQQVNWTEDAPPPHFHPTAHAHSAHPCIVLYTSS